MAVKIFFCYAHEDETLLNKLKTHLKPLQRQGLIDVWHDRDISAGMEWEREISEQLKTAQIILLLVSPDFMDSEYCYSKEMQRAMERHERAEALVIPIILRHIDWEGVPFNKLQALPKDSKPVLSRAWRNADEAFTNIAKGIRKVVEEHTSQFSASLPAEPIEASKPEPATLTSAFLEPSVQASLPQPTALQQSNKSPLIRPTLVVPKVPDIPIEYQTSLRPLPKGFKLLRTLVGHSSRVTNVAISCDGQTLVSGSADETIKVWNLHTGELLQTLEGYSHFISIAISSDGQTLVTTGGSRTRSIKFWNLHTGEIIRDLKLPILLSSVSSLAINSQSKALLATGHWDSTIRIWDLNTEKYQNLRRHSDAVTSIAFSPGGKFLLSCGANKMIKYGNWRSRKPLYSFKGHQESIHSVALSPDIQTFVSGSADKSIKLWDLKTGKRLHTFLGHSEEVLCVIFSPDSRTLASSSRDRTIKLWDLTTHTLLVTLEDHHEAVSSIAFHPDGRLLASGSDDWTIKIWEIM